MESKITTTAAHKFELSLSATYFFPSASLVKQEGEKNCFLLVPFKF